MEHYINTHNISLLYHCSHILYVLHFQTILNIATLLSKVHSSMKFVILGVFGKYEDPALHFGLVLLLL